jgi:hypothetical protein
VTSPLFLYQLLAFLVLEGDIILNIVDKFHLNFIFYSLKTVTLKKVRMYILFWVCTSWMSVLQYLNFIMTWKMGTQCTCALSWIFPE